MKILGSSRHADEAGAWLQGIKVFRYSDETAKPVASGKTIKNAGQYMNHLPI